MKAKPPVKRSPSGAWIVLGLLDQTPQHGYALYQRICADLRGIWRIEMNRLYRLLEEMVEAGLIQSREERAGNRPLRHVFHPTAQGRRQFEAWLRAPSDNMQQMRVDFPARLFFALRRGPQTTRDLIAGQQTACEQILRRLLAARQALSARGAHYELVYDFRLRQVQAALDWLADCAARCEEDAQARMAG